MLDIWIFLKNLMCVCVMHYHNIASKDQTHKPLQIIYLFMIHMLPCKCKDIECILWIKTNVSSVGVL